MKNCYTSHTYLTGRHIQRDCQKNSGNALHWYLHCGWAQCRTNAIKNALFHHEMTIGKVWYIYITLQKTERVWSRNRRIINWNTGFLPLILNSASWLSHYIRQRWRPSLCLGSASWTKYTDIWYLLFENSEVILTSKLFLLLTWESRVWCFGFFFQRWYLHNQLPSSLYVWEIG